MLLCHASGGPSAAPCIGSSRLPLLRPAPILPARRRPTLLDTGTQQQRPRSAAPCDVLMRGEACRPHDHLLSSISPHCRVRGRRLGAAGTLGQGRGDRPAAASGGLAWLHVVRSVSIGCVSLSAPSPSIRPWTEHFRHGARSRRAHRFRVVSRFLSLL